MTSIDTSPGSPGTTLNESYTLGTFHYSIFEFIRYALLLVFFRLLEVACAVFLLEPFYSTGCIDVFLLASVERMAH